jgi:hypothetical protein
MENYLTELLALAVMVDWRPIAQFLAGIDMIDGSRPLTAMT